MHVLVGITIWLACATATTVAAQPTARTATQPSTDTPSVETWAPKRVSVVWQDEPLADALVDLVTQLQYPLWTSDETRRLAATKRVSFVGRDIAAVSALNAVCRLAGLHWVNGEGAIIITAQTDAPMVWQLKRAGLLRRLRRKHPEWLDPAGNDRTADLDLVDASIRTAMQRLGKAFGVTLATDQNLLASQKLVTLQGTGLTLDEALSHVCDSLGARADVDAGVIWLATDAERNGRPYATTTLLAGETDGGIQPAQRWLRMTQGSLQACGWEGDVTAVHDVTKTATTTRTSTRESPRPEAR